MKREWPLITAAGALILAVRLPFLSAGYGVDPDAWRVANAARHIGETGSYVVSRFPGYPVQELTYSLLYKCQPWVWNLLTALLSVAAAVFLMLILRSLGSRNYVLAGVAFAFTPIVYLNSVNSMDYLWALAFAMASLYCATTRRPYAAGVLLGTAVGCRITSVLMGLPAAIALLQYVRPERRCRTLLSFGALTITTAAAAFFPVFRTYGIHFLRYYWVPYPSWPVIAGRLTVEVWGVVGLLAIVASLASLALKNRWAELDTPPAPGVGRMLVTGWAATIILYVLVFLKLPCESAYLIPAVPLVLLILAAKARRSVFVGACILIIASSQFMIQPHSVSFPYLRVDQIERGWNMEIVDRALKQSELLPDPEKSVVVMGIWEPMILNRLPSHHIRVHLVATLDSPSIKTFRARGYHVYTINSDGGLDGAP